jgi:UDP-N-acetylmuramoyl-tripeptide--D-alanyl-D-alanine ligase
MRPSLQRLLSPYFFFWARLVLRRRRPCIVAVTGSAGKTTTKEMIAAVLMHPNARPLLGMVWKTPGNENDLVGLPMAVLGLPMHPTSGIRSIPVLCIAPIRALLLATFASYPKILVLEYSITYRGERGMSQMARLAPPTVAVITIVGPAHLEYFESVDQIAQAKGALLQAVPPSGLVVLGEDNSYASDLARMSRAPVVQVPGRGRELAENVARAVARYFRVPEETINRAMAGFAGVERRLHQLELRSITVIDDAFNANPMSMRLGLDTLAERALPGQRRVAILGTMAELGADAPRYHQEIATYARERADVVIGVGALARHYGPAHWFANSKECAISLAPLIEPGDYVLVKGSHSVHLDRVVDELERMAAGLLGAEHGCRRPPIGPRGPGSAMPPSPAQTQK